MGQTAVYTLGIPYIDDNVASKESPLYFGESSPNKPSFELVERVDGEILICQLRLFMAAAKIHCVKVWSRSYFIV